jgi:hypothetical protein
MELRSFSDGEAGDEGASGASPSDCTNTPQGPKVPVSRVLIIKHRRQDAGRLGFSSAAIILFTPNVWALRWYFRLIGK